MLLRSNLKVNSGQAGVISVCTLRWCGKIMSLLSWDERQGDRQTFTLTTPVFPNMHPLECRWKSAHAKGPIQKGSFRKRKTFNQRAWLYNAK